MLSKSVQTDYEQLAIELLRKLELRNIQLDAVLQLTQAINYNFSNTALIEIYRYLLNEELKIKNFLLYLQEPAWKKYASRSLKLSDYPANPDKLFPFKQQGPLGKELQQLFPGFELVIPVIVKQDPIAFVLLSKPEHEDPDLVKELLSYVQGVTNIVAVANENRKLQERQLQQEKISNELSLAAKMQSMLIPGTGILEAGEGVAVIADYLPHRDVGGDYYDIFPINDEELVFCVADVSGKGVPAALLMSNFQANLRALIKYHPSLVDLVNELNKAVLTITQGDKFITLFIGKLNRQTGLLKYISAGHVPPLLCRNGQTQELSSGTTLLGIFETLPFVHLGKVQLVPGDTLLAFTDGMTENNNYREQPFGSEGVESVLKLNYNKTLLELRDALMQALKQHRGNREFDDDLTLLSLRFGRG